MTDSSSTATTAATETPVSFNPECVAKLIIRAIEWHTMLVLANKKEHTDAETPFAIARALVIGGLCDTSCLPPLFCDLKFTKEQSEALLEQINKCVCRQPCAAPMGLWGGMLYNNWYNSALTTPDRAANMLHQIAAQGGGFPVLNLPKAKSTSKKSTSKK